MAKKIKTFNNMNIFQIQKLLDSIEADKMEVLDLHYVDGSLYLETARPAVITDGNVDESYDVLTVSEFVGSYGKDDEVDIDYPVERFIEICAEGSDEVICAFIVTPDHEAIYIYKNFDYPSEFCDEVAELLVGYESEVFIA